MNEFPRLRARLDALELKLEALEQHARHAEAVIIRLAEQVHLLQQKRRPERPRKADEN